MKRVMILLRNAIVWIMSFLLIMPPQWVLAADPIVIDGSAPAQNQAALATTPSGKMLLNIVAPNAAGVSHNKFTDFNVTSSGLVINNATALATTNLAGVIEANPNFSGTAASLILNEVTSSNRSTLSGPTEIGGQAADYILANPNGITCNGCGFINTPRATLTTGTPTFTGNALTGLSVNAGDVVIEGLGLDATQADKFDIVTRATSINAQINAKDLGVHTGRQDFDYIARSGTAKVDDGSTKPTFAIDSTALGGMYAGRITLVGTEAGLGVRIAGDMAASTADMILTADGKLELKSNLSAATSLTLTSTASDIVADKDVYGAGTLTATASAGTVTATAGASFGAAGDVTIKAANVTTETGGKFVAGMNGSGALTTSGALDVQATTQISTGDGFMGGGASVLIKAPTVDLSRAADDNSESVRSRGTLTIESGSLNAANGRIASDGAMTLKGNSPIVLGAGLYQSATTINLTGDSVTSAATIVSDDQVNITSTIGDITNTGSMTAGTTATLNSAANISNSGTIESQTGTTVTAAGTLTNASGAKIKSATTTSVTTGGTLSNVGSIFAVNAATLIAPTIDNTGSIAGGTNLDINVATLTNLNGVLHAQNNFTVTGYGGAANAVLFDNASGVVETVVGDIAISADTIKNRKSVFSYSTYSTGYGGVPIYLYQNGPCSQWDDSGSCSGYENRIYRASSPIGDALIYTAAYASPLAYYNAASISSDSASGFIYSGKDVALSASTITNDKSTISAFGNINLVANTLNNQAVFLSSQLYGGTETANYPISLLLSEIVYTGDSLIQAGGNLTVTSSGGVRNGTEKVFIAPPAGTYNVDANNLATTPTPSALLNTSQYVDLIPGRDALFVASADPATTFVFETRVDFITVANYFGSDYFLSKLDVTPEQISSRLGDAYFDTTLVREAILRETGRRWLDTSVEDDIQQMKTLLDNGAQATNDLQLAFGVTLTAEQINALTANIVIYVEETYQGRTVLVPKVYLASATRAKLTDRGAIIAGDNVTINAASIDNDKSVIRADTDLTLTASGDLKSTSAKLKAGGDIALKSTGGSIDISTQVDTFNVQNYGLGANVLSVQHARSTVDAGGKLTVTANDNISILGADVTVGGDASLTAGGDVTVGAKQMRTALNYYSSNAQETKNIGSTFQAGGKFDLSAGADANIQGSRVTAGGDVNVTAVGNVGIEATVDTYNNASDRGEHLNIATNTAARLEAGGDLNVTSGNTARVKASALSATGDLSLQATGDVVIESAQDAYDLKLKNYKLNTITQQSAELTAGGDVTVGSLVGDLSIIASKVDSGGAITLNTPGGTLYLGARKDYREEHISDSKSGAFITTYSNRGTIDETVVPTLLTANGNIAIVTGDGIIVDYKDTGSFTDSIDQLSQAPGLAWMADLRARNDVTWNAVQEAHQSWDYHTQGISPTGAALISLAVAYAMPAGMGSQLAGLVAEGGQVAGSAAIGSTITLASGATVTVTNASLVAAVDMGFSSLVSQAAQALVGNGGDIGATLKQLGSTATLKTLATSMITAGLMEGLPMEQLGLDPSKTAPFAEKLKYNIATSSISATVDSVINGTPLGANLKNGLINAAVTVIGAEASGAIGEATRLGDLNKATQLIAHAALGCGMGAVTGGDCASGAGGAVVGELTATMYALQTEGGLENDVKKALSDNDTQKALQIIAKWESTGVDLSRLIGGLSVAVAGGDVDTAAMTAGNAAENNALCAGLCVGTAALVAAIYTYYSGDGDFVAGVEAIGAGEDPLSKAIESGVVQAVEMSYEAYPNETRATLDVIGELGGAIDAKVQYVDDVTGNTVSGYWNSLDESTQNRIKGGGALVSIVLPAGSVSKLANIKNLPQLSRGDAVAVSKRLDAETVTKLSEFQQTGPLNTFADSLVNAGVTTVDPSNLSRKFWTTETNFGGNIVFQRNDLINPNSIDLKTGLTNMQLMRLGRAPIGPDGNPITLHHMLQTQSGSIAEVTQTFHATNSKVIHVNPNTIPSGIDRNTFKVWKKDYWINRANDFVE